MKGDVIWVTGLSGAGKTTLCKALFAELSGRTHPVVVLDGESLRKALGDDLGYSEEHRIRQVRRLQGLARLLADQGVCVLVAALYSRPDLLFWNRAHLSNYFEVYLAASLESLQLRDAKGLYSGGRAGAIQNVVGLDIPWHSPPAPDLVIDTTNLTDQPI